MSLTPPGFGDRRWLFDTARESCHTDSVSVPPLSSLSPELLCLLNESFPSHPDTPEFWKCLAAEVGDEFRPEIRETLYRDLIRTKLRFVVEGTTPALEEELRGLQSAANRELFAAIRVAKSVGITASFETEQFTWLRKEILEFEKQLRSREEVGDLEQIVLRGLSRESGSDLIRADARTRSRAFLNFLEDTGEEWEGLSHSLLQHVVRTFPDLERDAGFWARLQRYLGPRYTEAGIEEPRYVELLNLQIRAYGFQEPPGALRTSLSALRERVSQSGTSPWDRQIEDLFDELRDRQFDRGTDPTPNSGR